MFRHRPPSTRPPKNRETCSVGGRGVVAPTFLACNNVQSWLGSTLFLNNTYIGRNNAFSWARRTLSRLRSVLEKKGAGAGVRGAEVRGVPSRGLSIILALEGLVFLRSWGSQHVLDAMALLNFPMHSTALDGSPNEQMAVL